MIQRTAIVSWFYIAAYVSMIIPVLFTGWVADWLGLPTAFGALGILMTIGGLIPLFQAKDGSLSAALTE